MSESTPTLNLPLILPAQAQKHLTHNEALMQLDTAVQLSVKSAVVPDAPANFAEGDAFLVPANGAGGWAGQAQSVAVFCNGGWQFSAPQIGWRCYVEDTQDMMVFDGSIWKSLAPEFQDIEGVGINASFDHTNRMVVASDASLLTHDGAGHQLKINRADVGQTASVLFQNNWMGQAELGMVGSDDFQIKTSADGASFDTALAVNAQTALTTIKGLSSGEINVEQNAVGQIVPPASSGFFLLTMAHPTYPQLQHSGIFLFDTGSSLYSVTIFSGSAMTNLATASLTGTTGQVGGTSLALAPGAIQVENRFNRTAQYKYLFLCT